MDELMLDGNAVAGVLQEVFAVETTTAIATCGGCGAAGPIAALHVYRGAGIVLRCPHCDNVIGKIVEDDTRMWISLSGARTVQVAV
jgi:recombinational DNA repair protein (RecF pathway)